MLTPEDLSLAESLLRSGKITPEALQKHLSANPGKNLSQSLSDAGLLPKAAGGSFDRTMMAGATSGPEPAAKKRIGRYDILEEIARGGMGVVYRAWEPDLGRNVALKVMLAGDGATEEQVQRFLREARSAAGLKHPNIVQVYEVGIEGGTHFLAMEFVDGQPLNEMIAKKGPLAPRTAVRIARDVARALHFAHERGIVHRDVKPANVLVSQDALSSVSALEVSSDGEAAALRVKLGDFGLAKDMGAGSSLTVSGNLIGTPAYMSPEQAAGHGAKLDARSDVYSLGAVLYEMLAGRTPFSGESLGQVLADIRSVEPVSLRKVRDGLSRDVEVIAAKAMAKEPARRYQTAGELAEDLDRWLAGEAIQAVAPSIGYRVARFVRRRRAAVSAAAVCVLALATLGGWLGFRVKRDRREQERQAASREAGRRDAALSSVRAGRDLAGRGEFEAAFVQFALAEAAYAGLPEVAAAARDARLSQALRQLDQLLEVGNWSGAESVLNAASEFRSEPRIMAAERRWRGTATVATSSAEPGLQVELVTARRGACWDEESLPPLDDLRALGLAQSWGPAPTVTRDLAFGDYILVFLRGGAPVRVVPVRLGRLEHLDVEYRVLRAGPSKEATHRSLVEAARAAKPGAVIELEDGVHAIAQAGRLLGVLVRPAKGCAPSVGRTETVLHAGASHGLALRDLEIAEATRDGLLVAGACRPSFVRCRFRDIAKNALVLRQCDDWVVRDCEFRDIGESALLAEGCRGGAAARVAFERVGEGFGVEGDDVAACRLQVADSDQYGVRLQGARHALYESRIERCVEWGVFATDVRHTQIEDNLIVDCALNGTDPQSGCLNVTFSISGRVAHNTVARGGRVGIAFRQADGRCVDSIVWRNAGIGAHYHGGVGTFDFLLSHGNGVAWRFWEKPFATAAEAAQAKGGFLQHPFEFDPAFVDAEKGDFRLAPDSRARGAASDGSDLGARLERIAADPAPSHELVRRLAGDAALRRAIAEREAGRMDQAREAFREAEILWPAHPEIGRWRESLR